MNQDNIFTTKQSAVSEYIRENPLVKVSTLPSNEIRSLITGWCYYSGKIEGNTYTLVETDVLLNDNITSPKDYGDAKMLKNLQNAFTQELYYITKEGHTEKIDLSTLLRLHRVVTWDLLDPSDCGQLRSVPVTITGTAYLPPRDKVAIQYGLNRILEEQYAYDDPLERAVYLHCNIAKLQPFRDGNKRISRLMESLVLMNADITPPYSLDKEDILSYRDAIIWFYETGDYGRYADFALGRHLKRIRTLSTSEQLAEVDLQIRKLNEPKYGLNPLASESEAHKQSGMKL